MTREQAIQISNLVNERNQLTKAYTSDSIMDAKDGFVFFEEENEIAACAECKKVQWYQWEICHVSVPQKFERRGFGTRVLKSAERKAIDGGAKILQCTIRVGNVASELLFLGNQYLRAISFFNESSGNRVNVYQKNVTEQ